MAYESITDKDIDDTTRYYAENFSALYISDNENYEVIEGYDKSLLNPFSTLI